MLDFCRHPFSSIQFQRCLWKSCKVLVPFMKYYYTYYVICKTHKCNPCYENTTFVQFSIWKSYLDQSAIGLTGTVQPQVWAVGILLFPTFMQMKELAVVVNLLGPFWNSFFLKEVVPVTELFIFFTYIWNFCIYLFICKFYTM